MKKLAQPTVVLADNDWTFQQDLIPALDREGYLPLTAINQYQLLRILQEEDPVLILMDPWEKSFSLPETMQSLEQLHPLMSPKLVVLTNKQEEDHEVRAFHAGVDGYLVKPVYISSFMLRIKRLMRPRLHDPRQAILNFQDIEIRRKERSVYWKGKEVPFQQKTFELLMLLADHADEVISRAALLQEVWDVQGDSQARTVDVHILKIRKKIGADRVQTIKGVGYKFVSQP